MNLAIFDLDNTLIKGDSDHAWGEFLVKRQLVDVEYYAKRNHAFYADYLRGALDIEAYLNFCLQILSQHPKHQLLSWREEFIEEKIKPMLLPKAEELINAHRTAGDTLLIITATNRFVTEPIAELLNIEHLLASEVEEIDGVFTGKPCGIPCYQHGKIQRLDAWLAQQGFKPQRCAFYSDSHNDLPLLKQVDMPVAIDPDPVLRAHAAEHGWPIRSLR